MRALLIAIWTVLFLALPASTPSSAGSRQTLTFDRRVAAQEAIERIRSRIRQQTTANDAARILPTSQRALQGKS